MNPAVFYDSSALDVLQESIFNEQNISKNIIFSSIAVEDVEWLRSCILKYADNYNMLAINSLLHRNDTKTSLENELIDACWYDHDFQPDNTIFITADKEIAELANLYFGEDSIILIDID